MTKLLGSVLLIEVLATRLDRSESARLWEQQARRRAEHPNTWWQGLPQAWVR